MSEKHSRTEKLPRSGQIKLLKRMS